MGFTTTTISSRKSKSSPSRPKDTHKPESATCTTTPSHTSSYFFKFLLKGARELNENVCPQQQKSTPAKIGRANGNSFLNYSVVVADSPHQIPLEYHLAHPSLSFCSSLIAIEIPERDRYQQLPDLPQTEPLYKDKPVSRFCNTNFCVVQLSLHGFDNSTTRCVSEMSI